jgi:hypothetical protein
MVFGVGLASLFCVPLQDRMIAQIDTCCSIDHCMVDFDYDFS